MATSGTIEGNWVDYGGNHFWARGDWSITETSTKYTVSMAVYVIIGPWHYEDLSNFKIQYAFKSTESWYPSGGITSSASGYIDNSGNSSSTSPKYIGTVSWTYDKGTSAAAIRPYLRVWDYYLGTGYSTASASGTVYTVPALVTTYTVSYNANGGSGAPASQTKTKDVTLKLSTTVPTRTGYTFKGWGTSSTTTTVSYAAGANYTANANITLYAIWTANVYTITFNANGGSLGSVPSTKTKNHGVNITLPTATPTYSGYTFDGWATSSTATSSTYNAGSTFSTNANTTLYAMWKYTVTYNGNGSTGGSTTAQSVNKNSNVTLRSNGFTKTHYNFSKWNTEADGTGTSYNNEATYTGKAAITLYAQWVDKPTHTVSYDANGGDANSVPSSQIKYENENLTLSSTIPVNENEGPNGELYNFRNWNTNSSGTGTSYNAGGVYTSNSTTDVTLFAQWTTDWSQVYYDYTFYNNDNTDGILFTESKQHGSDYSYTIPNSSTAIPTREHYIFSGWSLDEPTEYNSGDVTIYQPGATINIDKDTSFFAVWTPEPYNITFEMNPPLDNYGNPQSVLNMPSTEIKRYDEIHFISNKIPTSDNYIFRNWVTDLENENAVIYQPGEEYDENTPLTLYATWNVDNAFHTIINIGEAIPNYGWIDIYSAGDWDKGINYHAAGANSAHIMWFAHSKLQALKFKIDTGT